MTCTIDEMVCNIEQQIKEAYLPPDTFTINYGTHSHDGEPLKKSVSIRNGDSLHVYSFTERRGDEGNDVLEVNFNSSSDETTENGEIAALMAIPYDALYTYFAANGNITEHVQGNKKSVASSYSVHIELPVSIQQPNPAFKKIDDIVRELKKIYDLENVAENYYNSSGYSFDYTKPRQSPKPHAKLDIIAGNDIVASYWFTIVENQLNVEISSPSDFSTVKKHRRADLITHSMQASEYLGSLSNIKIEGEIIHNGHKKITSPIYGIPLITENPVK